MQPRALGRKVIDEFLAPARPTRSQRAVRRACRALGRLHHDHWDKFRARRRVGRSSEQLLSLNAEGSLSRIVDASSGWRMFFLGRGFIVEFCRRDRQPCSIMAPPFVRRRKRNKPLSEWPPRHIGPIVGNTMCWEVFGNYAIGPSRRALPKFP